MDSGRQLQLAYRQLANQIEPNVLITLGHGPRSISEITFSGKVDHFFNRVQRNALGRNWAKYPAELRISAAGYTEHLNSEPHLHLVARASLPLRKALHDAKSVWRSIRPGAHYYCQYLDDPADYVSYISKDFLLNLGRTDPYVYAASDHIP